MKFIPYGGLALSTALIEIAQTTVPEDPTDPLINRGEDKAIYIGIVLLVLAIAFAVKSLSTKVEHILLFAFGLSLLLVLVLWYL